MGSRRGKIRAGAAAAAVAVAALAAGTPSSAQGFYYKEIAKDGRIYVFNVASNAERFEESEEAGAAIAKPGAGPNGETVIGDNERALQLFFFKHGMSEPVPEPDPPAPAALPYKFSGLVFGDYYYFAGHHDPRWESQQGFWLRRAYFTYDHALTPRIAARFRLEALSNGKLAGGSITPQVKDAYLRWTYTGRQQVTLGIQPTLSFDFVEAFWGLRHIEKTPLDLYRWDSSRDFGVTASGPINEAGTLKYGAQFGNESNAGSETNRGKAYRAAARYETAAGFSIEGYVSRFERDRDADWWTAQVFAGYRGKGGRIGGHYSYQERRAGRGSGAADESEELVSVFGVVEAVPRKLSAFARLDFYADPCPLCPGIDYLPIAPGASFTTTIAGVEYYLLPSVRFSPNFEWVNYRAPGAAGVRRPDDDVVARATFFWTW